MLKKTGILICIFTLLFISPVKALAVSYEPYSYDSRGEAVPSQAGYTATKSVTGCQMGAGSLSEPMDIFIDSNHFFYIADTGNDRIVKADPSLESTEVYDTFLMPDGSETVLSQPNGVYVSQDFIYIADSGNSRILVSDYERNVVMTVEKPDSELYDRSKTFIPQKVIVDRSGRIYAVLGNITSGCAVFSADGEFEGFYGANRVEPSAGNTFSYIRNFFMTYEKRLRRTRSIPSAITNFDIDGDFIFTCSSSSTQKTDTIKELSPSGSNILPNQDTVIGDYPLLYDTDYKVPDTSICDIDVSENGTVNCLDFATGRVFQYDKDCNLLFIMGTLAKQTGGFERVSAVESDGEKVYVLDSSKNSITVFEETGFGKAVHKAVELYSNGFYEEALEPWYRVLEYDGNYRRAYIGIASALYNKGDYKGSMRYAKLADSPEIYSKAFESYRSEFVRKNFGILFAVILTLIGILYFIRKKLHRQ